MKIPTITTSRTLLRALNPSDIEPLHQIMSNPAVLRYFPSENPPPMEKVRKMLPRQRDHWAEHGYGWWALALRESGELMGWCGLNYLPETGETELKYMLGEPFWGQGLATEAAGTSVRWGFEGAGLGELIGLVHPENLASRRVLEKVGMRYVDEVQYFGMDCLLRYRMDVDSLLR